MRKVLSGSIRKKRRKRMNDPIDIRAGIVTMRIDEEYDVVSIPFAEEKKEKENDR